MSPTACDESTQDSLPDKKNETMNQKEVVKETPPEAIQNDTKSEDFRHPKFVIELHLKEDNTDTR